VNLPSYLNAFENNPAYRVVYVHPWHNAVTYGFMVHVRALPRARSTQLLDARAGCDSGKLRH
jgi:hypothetical protein